MSIVLSFRNEDDNLDELIRRLRGALDASEVDHELVFVNDSSTDRSLEILTRYAAADPRVKVLTTSRRWGVYACLFEGMSRTHGDAVIYLDSDLQDPPELIPEMVSKWQAGADVVLTVRRQREGESRFKMFLTRMAYRLIRSVVYEVELPVNAGDFRLMSRRVVEHLLRFQERSPYFRGLVSWIGFKQDVVLYDRAPRAAGEPKFPIFRHFFRDLATLRGPVGTLTSAITSFSLLPLLLFIPFGVITILLSSVALLGGLLRWASELPSGIWWIVGVVGMLAGLQLIAFGILGLYLARVFDEVRARPRAIVDERLNINI